MNQCNFHLIFKVVYYFSFSLFFNHISILTAASPPSPPSSPPPHMPPLPPTSTDPQFPFRKGAGLTVVSTEQGIASCRWEQEESGQGDGLRKSSQGETTGIGGHLGAMWNPSVVGTYEGDPSKDS